MLAEHFIFLTALGVYAASAVWLARHRAIFSPQFIASMVFLLMGVLSLFPQLTESTNRSYQMTFKAQVFILVAAVIFAVTNLYVRRPEMRPEYPRARWKLLPRRAWLFIFFIICMADPLLSILLHGHVGLVQGNESMGTAAGGAHSDAFTPLTFIAWSCASMAITMLLTDFLFSSQGFLAYVSSRLPDLALVVICLGCTALSGNRFVLICQVLAMIIGLSLFSKLRLWMLVSVGIFLGVFFVVVGNYRFGTVDIVENLKHPTGIKPVDMLYAWVTTYSEPNFLNLDNFLRDQPAASWGMDWVTTVLPSAIVDALGLERHNSADWFGDNSLYAYHGMTFRTMYPDLIMDFGDKGALTLSALFLMLGVRIYNRALCSPYHFVLFLCYTPLVLFMPLLAAFYSLPNLAAFGVVFLLRRSSSRVIAIEDPPPEDESSVLLVDHPVADDFSPVPP